MKWLLFTAINNPGDQFVRIGVENLIRAVDTSAVFYSVDKESIGVDDAVAFDRAVVCGMPLAWSHDTEGTWNEIWWPALNRIARQGPTLLAGVGSFTRWKSHESGFGSLAVCDRDRLKREIGSLVSVCCGAYARDPIFNRICGSSLPVLPCPSIFSLDGIPKTTSGFFCNLMPDGAHYTKFGPEEVLAWRSKRAEVSRVLRDRGFTFVAHSGDEFYLALNLGWPRERIIGNNGNPVHLLETYRNTSVYIGNRVHGAIVSRAAGGKAWCIGYDGRMSAVELVGAKVCEPSMLDLSDIEFWLDRISQPRLDVESHRPEQLEIFRRFAGV